MTKQKSRDLPPHNKRSWKKLDKIEKFENTLEGKWVQKGPYIVNTGSKMDYGLFIGIDKRLMGVDESGKPIIESI